MTSSECVTGSRGTRRTKDATSAAMKLKNTVGIPKTGPIFTALIDTNSCSKWTNPGGRGFGTPEPVPKDTDYRDCLCRR